MPEVFVGVGSNIERGRNIRSALVHLERRFGALTVSPVYESEAVGFAGDNFYNLVVAFATDLSLEALSDALHEIEAAHGRSRGEQKFRPRTLDLDLLLYGDHIEHSEQFDLPRREISRYAFVLLPLSDIAGDRVHPETGRTYADMWAEFRDDSQSLWPVLLE